MNEKDLEKLQKFYALACSECNENEATVAARKYVKMIKKLNVYTKNFFQFKNLM